MNLTQTVTWIPVEERLPDTPKFYPVAGLDLKGRRFTGLACLTSTDEWDCEETVTHWSEPLKHPATLAEAEQAI